MTTTKTRGKKLESAERALEDMGLLTPAEVLATPAAEVRTLARVDVNPGWLEDSPLKNLGVNEAAARKAAQAAAPKPEPKKAAKPAKKGRK